VVATVAAVAVDAYNLDQAYQYGAATGDYTGFTYEVGATAASWAGALAGAKVGASIGATVGTFIAPGAGTVIGGVVGGVAGGIIGSNLATGAYNSILSWGEFSVGGRKWP